MLRIFIWTVVFASHSILFTFAVGLTLAVILQWEHLRFGSLYRILLILPNAVPAFISILVFRGLFNQNFGEINLILNALFGITPSWFTDGSLARVMLLTVNTWLGYPYMMLLAMGFLQSVPHDHKKAAALEERLLPARILHHNPAADHPAFPAAADRRLRVQFQQSGAGPAADARVAGHSRHRSCARRADHVSGLCARLHRFHQRLRHRLGPDPVREQHESGRRLTAIP